MANVIEATDSNFNEIVVRGSEKPVLVHFWAEWCGPCLMVSPIVEQLAGEYDGKAIMASLDVDTNPDSPKKYGIRSIPTLLFFKDGEIVDKKEGNLTKYDISNKLDELLW